MVLFSHPTGNANVRHAALGLWRAGLLSEFWTCIDNTPGNPFTRLVAKVLPVSMRSQLERRSFPKEVRRVLRTHPAREAARLAAHRLGLDSLTRHETGPLSVDAVYRSLDLHVARRARTGEFKAVYAYEDGAGFTFREARRRGLAAFYDLPIGYWRAARALLTEEAELEPGWASTLIGNDDSRAKTERKDEELALADRVFVASTFTRKTLAEYRGTLKAAVEIIPYGAPVPSVAAVRQSEVRDPKSGALRVLFVGSLGQRKGISYLFGACRKLGTSAGLTVIGARPLRECAALDSELRREGVRWIPSCAHAQVLAEMASHDVLVFPSLFEGFGLVLLEAMAMGLPVIATAHTAAPDLITDGAEGFIVPIRSADAIAEKLDLLRRDRERLRGMGRRAAARAAMFTWENYGARLAASVARATAAHVPRTSAPPFGGKGGGG